VNAICGQSDELGHPKIKYSVVSWQLQFELVEGAYRVHKVKERLIANWKPTEMNPTMTLLMRIPE
jgi:hypothetical protein